VFKLAQIEAQRGDPAAAIERLQAYRAANPADDDAALGLASFRILAGDHAGAVRDYETILAKDPAHAPSLNNLAWLYLQLRDDRAEATARKAVAAAPGNPDIADTLGWILAQSAAPGAAAEAVTILEGAARSRPANPSFHYHLAVAQRKAGRNREAEASVARALSMAAFPERSDAEALAKALSGT
jgi:Flp pilus assembly protein TadD